MRNYKIIWNIIQLHFSLNTPSKRSCLTNNNLSDYYPLDLHLWPLIIIIIRFRASISGHPTN